jgi:hypothetical protein
MPRYQIARGLGVFLAGVLTVLVLGLAAVGAGDIYMAINQ